MVIAIAFPGFNEFGRTVTPIFLLIDLFLYQFSGLSEKMKKIYWWFSRHASKLNYHASRK